jgi:organic hydroperoxide reductase OsmC/OhrA
MDQSMKEHTYNTDVVWTGNEGVGTKNFRSYRRDYTITSGNKVAIQGSSDPAYRGDPTRFNPEDLLVASLSSCHMLWYLHLCSVKAITVVEYQDNAEGVMEETPDGSGRFTGVRLAPRVKILEPHQAEKAASLHHEAHELCLIARSVNFPVNIAPEISIVQQDLPSS